MAVCVLIVDDEINLRRSLAAYLDDEGMGVLAAGSGAEALELLEDCEVVHVCVMDMRLPDTDGNEVIRAINAKYPTVRFLIHTGSAGYTLPDDLRRLGITSDMVFRKPLEDLRVIAEAVLALVGDE